MNMYQLYTESHIFSPAKVMEMGGGIDNLQFTGNHGRHKRLIPQIGQTGKGTQDNRLSTDGVTGEITRWIITATTNQSIWL